VKNINDIENYSCGDYFSAAINNKGELFTWGAGTDG
jgi:hypothetical protein